MPLRLLGQLDLPAEVHRRLLTQLTELAAGTLRRSLEEGALDGALAAHDDLAAAVTALATLRPELEASLWPRYGELLAQLVALAHGALFREGETAVLMSPQQEASLCWRLAGMLEGGLARPWSPPEWLPVLEQQLVQRGALAWQERREEGPEARERCLDLFLRLAQLQDPVAPWVAQACREGMEAVAGTVLTQATPDEASLAALAQRLERLPVAEEQRQAFETALLRTRLSLELMQAARRQARTGAEALEVVEPEWLDRDDGEPPARPLLRLILESGDGGLEPQTLSLAPFLDGDGEGAVLAVERFLASAPPHAAAGQPVPDLQAGLAARGLPMGEDTLMVLRAAAAAWQEALGERLVPLEPAVLATGALMVELDPLELALLWHLSRSPEQVEEALGELRRRHHDGDFWNAAAVEAFPALPEALEVLRRFQLQGGFYTSSHAPMESLQRWAQPALQALLQAQVWSGSAGTQALWLPWGAEGGGSLRHSPDAEGLLERLGGQEVLVVSEHGEAIREAHLAGRLFRGEPFGLRCLTPPASRHPQRPAAGFEMSLEGLIEAVDQAFRDRPFALVLADCGAYRLPLAQAVVSRYGVMSVGIAGGLPGIAAWLTTPCP
ncbi:hypothetical protein [Synechococcus sp. CCY 9618]|uniref:hypothetical protein n=1 Tax=Synechococcus sp. CCY 9618 TaxID=2815602 RepID=UPI001C22C618|nr:hypothetical protein [Synechococcus sp. CCY 9618]